MSCCDATQNPGDKRLLRWATARSGPEWGCGLLFAPSKDRVPVFSREPHRVWTDSKSAHTDTHRHVSLSSPQAGFTSSCHTCVGAQHRGEPGALAEGRGQPSSCPSPMHGSVPTSPCLIPVPQAEGAALLWPAPHQAPIASPTHAGLACRRDPGSSQGRAQCSHWDPNSPYLLFSPAPPTVLALGSLEKTEKRSKN